MKDLILDNTGDLLTTNNDLVIGHSNIQHQETLIISQPCSFFENPDICIGAEDFLNGNDEDNGLVQVTREQFVKDGQVLKSIDYNSETGDLKYDADYNN
jgi:hypothetical protein